MEAYLKFSTSSQAVKRWDPLAIIPIFRRDDASSFVLKDEDSIGSHDNTLLKHLLWGQSAARADYGVPRTEQDAWA